MGDLTWMGKKFPETNWAMVNRARKGDPSQRRKALEDLCTTYWQPVYTFARSRGNSPEDAEDLTQGFFAMLLERDFLARTDPKRGKLRSFLLASMKNFMHGEWRNATRLKRGGGKTVLSLDAADAERRYRAVEEASETPPDKIFDRHWFSTLLDNVMEKLRERCEAEGKAAVFKVLKAHLTPDATPLPPAEAAERLGTTENSAKVIAYRLRKRYARMLREAVADTLDEKEDVEAELSYLMGVFS